MVNNCKKQQGISLNSRGIRECGVQPTSAARGGHHMQPGPSEPWRQLPVYMWRLDSWPLQLHHVLLVSNSLVKYNYSITQMTYTFCARVINIVTITSHSKPGTVFIQPNTVQSIWLVVTSLAVTELTFSNVVFEKLQDEAHLVVQLLRLR